jgi:hypothetical protein
VRVSFLSGLAARDVERARTRHIQPFSRSLARRLPLKSQAKRLAVACFVAAAKLAAAEIDFDITTHTTRSKKNQTLEQKLGEDWDSSF